MAKSIEFDREFNHWGEFCLGYAPALPIVFEGKTYATAEHLYQACKYQYSSEAQEYAELIRQSSTPERARLLGRRDRRSRYAHQRAVSKLIDDHPVQPDPDWKRKELAVMGSVLLLKFEQDWRSRVLLRNTGNARLIYSSSDHYWGRRAGRGKNHFGRLLELVRSALPSESEFAHSPALWLDPSTF